MTALGAVGILVLIPITSAQLGDLPATALPAMLIAAIAAAQPFALLLAGAFAGTWTAPKLRLRSLVAERASGRPVSPAEFRGIHRLVAISVLLGVAINLADALTRPLWLPDGVNWPSYQDAWSPLTLLFGMLYGGLTEEVTWRWGLMSLILWLGRSVQRRRENVAPWIVAAAILLSALIFATGHFPTVAAMMPLSAGPVTRTLVLNSLAGLWLGWIFWRKHLEAAMLSHAAMHVGFAVYAVALMAFG